MIGGGIHLAAVFIFSKCITAPRWRGALAERDNFLENPDHWERRARSDPRTFYVAIPWPCCRSLERRLNILQTLPGVVILTAPGFVFALLHARRLPASRNRNHFGLRGNF
jgi:hypothetical protein